MVQIQRADLHCHSIYSDGSMTPLELINLAKQENLQGLSITDHDNIEAFRHIQRAWDSEDLTIIPGVEFSCDFQGNDVHILGYSFKPDHPALCELCQTHKGRRLNRNLKVLELLEKHGMSLKEEEVLSAIPFEEKIQAKQEKRSLSTCGRPHIAKALVNKGFVPDIATAFKKYLGTDRPCYTKGQRISVQDTLDVIRQARGVAVLAHPHLLNSNELARQLLKLNFYGIEAYYCVFASHIQQRWVKLAKERGLEITGGSDFHGTFKPHIRLGCSVAPSDSFQKLIRIFKENCL